MPAKPNYYGTTADAAGCGGGGYRKMERGAAAGREEDRGWARLVRGPRGSGGCGGAFECAMPFNATQGCGRAIVFFHLGL
ncbi:hypothetical protein PR202_gb21719 [Eleusine coracana subsp. coracana]|uniref:Uncharacterized protein n=1 Tax=Eleusine coracana subsp. coracana TaxID=191504 RepID=A0AAV5FDV5_ELECO|nr:hypothetical protein PR202_gb21719 [Eleusine coracana subsp. coracana]